MSNPTQATVDKQKDPNDADFDPHAVSARYHGKRLVYPRRSAFPSDAAYTAAWKEFYSQLPERQVFLDPKLHNESLNRLKKHQPLLFHSIYCEDIQHEWKYHMLLIGMVRGGGKAVVMVSGIEPSYDVRVPPGIEAMAFMNLLYGWFKESDLVTRSCRMEITQQFPPKEFSEKTIPYIRVYNDNTFRRSKQIRHIYTHKLTYFNAKTNQAVAAELETANDDTSCYYRVVSREYKLKLAAWHCLENYQDLAPSGFAKPGIRFVLRVDVKDLLDPERSRYLGNLPLKIEEHRDLVRDPAIMMTWDLETFAIRHTGDAPQIERVLTPEGKQDDIIIMQSALFHWYHEDEALVRVNFTDLPTPPVSDALVIQVHEQADIIQMKAIIMERMKQDYVSGFNDSSYDWPFVFRRAEALDKHFKYQLTKELKERTCVLRVTPEIAKYVIKGENNKIEVKIDADTKAKVDFLDVPGYICMDTRVIFRQLYPNAETSTLNSFLEANKLGKKEDMPYQTMFKIYRLMRQLAHDLGTSQYEEILAALDRWMTTYGPNYKPFEGVDLCDNPFQRVDASDYNIQALTLEEVINYAKLAENVVRYCNVDAQRCQELLRKRNIVADKREMANLSFTSTFDALYRANGMKVRNIVMASAVTPEWNLAFSNVTRDRTKSTKKYPGAYVIPPRKGLYRDHKFMKAARLLQVNRPDIFQALFGHLIEKARAANDPHPERVKDSWVNPRSPDFVKEIVDITVAYQTKLYEAMVKMPLSTGSKDAGGKTRVMKDINGVVINDKVISNNPASPKGAKTGSSKFATPDQIEEDEVREAFSAALKKGTKITVNVVQAAPGSVNSGIIPSQVTQVNITGIGEDSQTGERQRAPLSGAAGKAKRVEELDALVDEKPIRIRLPRPANNVREAMSAAMAEIMNGPEFTLNEVEAIERNNDIFPMTDRPNSGLDHSSLYPNIIITFNLSPEKCITDRNLMIALSKKKDRFGHPYRFREVVFHYKQKDEPKAPENEIRAWFVQYTPIEGPDPKEIAAGVAPEKAKKVFLRYDGMGIYPYILKQLFDMRVGLKGGLARFSGPLEFFNSVVNERKKNKLPAFDSYPLEQQPAEVLKAAEAELAKRKAAYEAKKKKLLLEKVHHMEKVIAYIKKEWDILAKGKPFSKFYDETAFGFNYYNAKQLALKVLMNTFYGETGFNVSPFFLVAVAGAITYYGQKMLKLPKAYVEDKGFSVIYGDTDSLYTSPPESAYTEVDALYESGQISKMEWWERMSELSMDVMDTCRDDVNKMLYEYTGTKFLSMAYEEVLWPYMMVGKKKYVGMKHEGMVDLSDVDAGVTFEKFDQSKILFVRGLELKKRGSSEVLKRCCKEVIYEAFNVNESRTLREICEDKLKEVKNRSWNPRMFIKTVKYKLPGKDASGKPRQGNLKVHEFMRRMKEIYASHPELGIREAELGERFEYIIVERYPHTYNIRGVAQGLSMGDRMEYANVVADAQTGRPNEAYEAYLGHPLKPDLDYYVTNELIGQLSRFIIYHPDYDRIYEYLRDIAEDADLDKIYKDADNKAHDMAKNQLTKFYEENYATKYRNYNTAVQTIYRKTSKVISEVWRNRYGEDKSRVLELATKMITSTNDDIKNIRNRFEIVKILEGDLELLATKEAEAAPKYDLRRIAEEFKLSPERLKVIYAPILKEREERAKQRLIAARRHLLKYLPEIQDFTFRQMHWLDESMKGLLKEIQMDKSPLPSSAKPKASRPLSAAEVMEAVNEVTGRRRKKKVATEMTESETVKKNVIQVKVDVPVSKVVDTVTFALDPEIAEDQELAADAIEEVDRAYTEMLGAKYTLYEVVYMRQTMDDYFREKNKSESRGADPRILADLKKPESRIRSDFASFLAKTETYVPGPNGMQY